MSYVLAFLGFAALILLHEGGHFAAAKAVGMRVERFSLFFGQMFVKRRIGETDYGIGVIPLGGYVKITGMSPEEEFETPEIAARAYVNQAVWKRIVVIAAGPGVNLVLAFVLAMVAFIGAGAIATNHRGQPIITNTVGSVTRGSAADGVLRPGDRIISVNGTKVGTLSLHDEIARYTCAGGVRTNGCVATTAATIVVSRGGVLKTLTVHPRWSAAYKEMLVGVELTPKIVGASVGTAAHESISNLWYVTKRSVTAITELFKPKERRQIHSLVGAYTIAANQISSGWVNGLWILAQISLALAIINLFPFLPLDGGHIFWALAEKVRGRRIPMVVIERASIIGIALIAIVFFVGLTNDISAFAGNGIGT